MVETLAIDYREIHLQYWRQSEINRDSGDMAPFDLTLDG